jgi:predicted dehydrogenase
MNDEKQIGVGILGAGNIAGPYAADLSTYSHIALAGVFDVDPAKATELSNKHSIKKYETLDEMLGDPSVDIVANLSAHHAHFELTQRCLNAGKHVHSERPLALNSTQAWKLVHVATEKNLRLSCSPFTWLGNASRALRTVVKSGRIGEPRLISAEVNWGFIESWHPSPAAFHKVGSLWDVGVYPLAFVTSMFGPARRVQSIARTLKPERVALDGTAFTLDGPEWMVTQVDFEGGVTMRLTTNFYVDKSRQRATLEVHGDDGTVRIEDWLNFDAAVQFATRKGEWEDVEYEKCGSYIRWGLAIADLATGLQENRSPLASGAHAAHIVDILEACDKSAREHCPIEIESEFPAPDLKEATSW